MRYLFMLTCLFSFLQANTLSLETLHNEKRVAYVIGNGDYDESPLEHSVSSAQKMKTFLQKNNFNVTYAEDANKRDMIKGLRNFSSNMQANSISLFYYSGHMVQLKGKNYLVPIENSVDCDSTLLHNAIELDAIISKMQKAESRLNILIIDSAFKKPFGDAYRPKIKGMAVLKKISSTDIILSTTSNSTTNPYLFTDKLINILSLKGVSNKEGFQTFKNRNKQSNIKLSKQDFYFNIPKKLEDKEKKEEEAWTKTSALGSITAYNAYLSSYPDGKYAKKALTGVKELKKKITELALKEKVDKSAEAKKHRDDLAQAKKLEDEAAKKAHLESNAKEETALIAAQEEKKTLIENTRFIEPLMVLIKAGSFTMGSDTGNEDEAPAHLVNIEEDFYIGKHEVTNVEYKEFLASRKTKNMIPPNWTTDMQPAVGVSWDDATAYAQWLSNLSGKRYRLPTEQEWEYVARAGADTRYYWGDRDTSHRKDSWRKEYPDNAHDYAWIKTNSENVSHDVGVKEPNARGVYDVIGNVWEWCSNAYTANYKAPVEEESLKIIRGGSWFSTPQETTLSHRGSNVNDFSSYNIGFRLLREK